jgi:peptidyl-prolyl cis-trans isomerase C
MSKILPGKRGVLVVLVVGLAGCSHPSAPSPTVATVGGEPLSQGLFDHYVQTRSGVAPTKLDANLRVSLLHDLKRLKAAAMVGAAHASLETTQELELQRLEILAHAAATSAGVYNPPTEAELQQAYDQYRASLPAREYHVAHILVATENMASQLLLKLQSGAEFFALAKAESADDSKARGGDLGWIAPGKLPAAFTDAVRALKVGEYTPKPVHTAYGWHLIRLLDSRAAAAPPLDQVRPQLAANLQQERYQKYLRDCLVAAGER